MPAVATTAAENANELLWVRNDAGQCRKLQFLMLDERQLTAAQLARLRQALPRLKLNGKSWK